MNAYFLLYFSIIKNSKSIKHFESNALLEQEVVAVKKLIFSFNEVTRNYELTMTILDNFKKEQTFMQSYSRLLKPYLHWVLFALSRKKNAFLYENDISVTKFRMIEFWNKDTELKISQDHIFSNNTGTFTLKIDPFQIEISNSEVFKKSYTFQEIFRKHAICFISKEVIEKEGLKNSKMFEKYMSKNFDALYADFFKID
jgi:hypothetical protein